MLHGKLVRDVGTDEGTFGVLFIGGAEFATGELPGRNNIPDYSRIPRGIYFCKRVKSSRFGNVFNVEDVPGRTKIRIHAGNFCGDTKKGYQSNSRGCILPGKDVQKLGKQMAVVSSRSALQHFHEVLKDVDVFKLEII